MRKSLIGACECKNAKSGVLDGRKSINPDRRYNYRAATFGRRASCELALAAREGAKSMVSVAFGVCLAGERKI